MIPCWKNSSMIRIQFQQMKFVPRVRAAVIDMSITPMMCGSAFKNKGVQAVLDAVCAYLPSPVDVDAVEGFNPKTDEPATRKPDAVMNRLQLWLSRSQPILL
jgi:translation elongation factor EF-G